MPTVENRIARLQAAVGQNPIERELLGAGVVTAGPHATINPGVNQTWQVLLDTGRIGYFKRFRAQSPTTAHHYGHSWIEVPTHEVVAWRLAEALGPPWDELVPVAVLRVVNGEPGVLLDKKSGQADIAAFTDAEALCAAGGFWDGLVGQQDRHLGQFRYDRISQGLGLIDHGFAFARTGDRLNASEFLAFRRGKRGPAISRRERVVLEALLQTSDLYGLALFLPADRAGALRARATAMFQTGILPLPLSTHF